MECPNCDSAHTVKLLPGYDAHNRVFVQGFVCLDCRAHFEVPMFPPDAQQAPEADTEAHLTL